MIISGGKAVDFAPQALGETTPLLNTGYFYGRDTLALSGKFATYGQMYRVQPSIATVVDKVANAGARLSINVWDMSSPAGKTLDTVSPYANILSTPNPVQSGYAFWRWTFSTYEVYGEAYWYKVRNAQGKCVALWPMHPSRVSVRRDEDGSVTYVFTIGVASSGILYAPETDVVPFQRFNPDGLMRGLSRLESLRTTLLNEDAARRATSSWWQRGARPAFMLTAQSKLSKDAADRLKSRIDAIHGGADNMGGTLVLEEGMTPQVVQLTADEMQYVETRKLNMQEVCMVYDVPPPVVHILDHATFSNITEQMRSLYRDTMPPRLEDIESVLDTHLRPEFDSVGKLCARFALDDVLRGDFETRAVAVQQLISTGVMKPSEGRPLFDLDDAGPVADKLYANAALQPLDAPRVAPGTATDGSPMPQPIEPPKPDPVEPPKAVPIRRGGARPGRQIHNENSHEGTG